MTELTLFILVGGLAVAFAAAMLLMQNAVYSALCLIGTMACIAVLFLMLDAPFLAMVQITVYAGAIMVLFIFVIMLLGAERVGGGAAPDPRYRWYVPLAIGLAIGFLLIIGIGLTSGGVNLLSEPERPPTVRVIHAAVDAGTVDVFANDRLIADDLSFREATNFVTLSAGENTVRLVAEDGSEITTTLPLEMDTAQSVVAYGTGTDVQFAVVPKDLTTPDNRTGRIVFFNGFPEVETVRVVDLGTNDRYDAPSATSTGDTALVENFTPGGVSEPLILPEGAINIGFVNAATGETLYRIPDFEVERNTSKLMVFGGRRQLDETVRPVADPAYVEDAEASFGGPESVGMELFTTYMLPFQLVAMLLLAAMVGAIVLTQRELGAARKKVGGRRRVSRPLATVIASQVGHDVTEPAPQAGDDKPSLPQPAGD